MAGGSTGPAKLVVFMTLPIDPDMKTAWEQQRMLQRVKGAFLDGDTSAVVVSLIAEPLARFEEKHRMDSSDTQIVQVNAPSALPQLPNNVSQRARKAASQLPLILERLLTTSHCGSIRRTAGTYPVPQPALHPGSPSHRRLCR